MEKVSYYEHDRLAEIVYPLRRGKVVVSLKEWFKYYPRIKKNRLVSVLRFTLEYLEI